MVSDTDNTMILYQNTCHTIIIHYAATWAGSPEYLTKTPIMCKLSIVYKSDGLHINPKDGNICAISQMRLVLKPTPKPIMAKQYYKYTNSQWTLFPLVTLPTAFHGHVPWGIAS